MMTLWTGFKQQNSASNNKIGPNEEDRQVQAINAFQSFNDDYKLFVIVVFSKENEMHT